MSEPLVKVTGVKKYFPITQGIIFQREVGRVHAVDGVDLEVQPGETLGIVGETGCGKSTLARLICRLLPVTEGTIEFDGQDITNMKGNQLRQLRREIQMIFQDPYSSLNPRKRVGAIIGDPFEIHGLADGKELKKRVQELMEIVGLNPEHYNRFPAEFSGGQRQRIGVARALALRPKLVICDEPVSALDVSIQAQVINLLEDLQNEFKLTYVFIAHDLSVVRHVSDRVGVMYLGKVVELADAQPALRRAQAPLHRGAAVGDPGARPGRDPAAGTGDPARGRALADRPAVGLPVPPPLPQGPGALRPRGAAAGAQGQRRPGRLPLPPGAGREPGQGQGGHRAGGGDRPAAARAPPAPQPASWARCSAPAGPGRRRRCPRSGSSS